MLNVWQHTDFFQPGTTVRADSMNFKLSGIAASLLLIAEHIDNRVPQLPASFAGNTQIPEKILTNSLLHINAAGNMDVYSIAGFEQKVADTAANAQVALGAKDAAANSAAQARISELAAAASAEIAQGAVGPLVGNTFFSGGWNASTGSYPVAPEEGSAIWKATANGTGATAHIKNGDLIMWNPISDVWEPFIGLSRAQNVEALAADITLQIAQFNSRANYIEMLASAGI